MHYMNALQKRRVFNLDLNRESMSEPRTLSGRLFQNLRAKYEKVRPPLNATLIDDLSLDSKVSRSISMLLTADF